MLGWLCNVLDGGDRHVMYWIVVVVEKFSSELQFKPEPSRTELQVQFKVWKFS